AGAFRQLDLPDSEVEKAIIGVIGNIDSYQLPDAKGHSSLSLHVKTRVGQQAEVLFEVLDTGIGIAKEKREWIFELFTQVSSTVNRNYGGTGLGLAITQRLLQLHQSKLQLYSEENKGSLFSFVLQYEIAKEEDVLDTNRPVPGSSLEKKKILLVDDNESNIRVALHHLKKRNLYVEVAMGGEEAVEKITQQKFDLVLMDLEMPKKDGYTAASEIRAMPGEAFQKLPLVALTAYPIYQIKRKLKSHGFNDYLSKPFKNSDFHRVLDTYLQAEED
ncbi:MAG: response regulator, partial [Spirochaetota bacterium]